MDTPSPAPLPPPEFGPEQLRYLRLLARRYPTTQAASTEIINLQAILGLPKGTEHFLSDLHGEHEAFDHVLRNASGVIRRKIEDLFGDELDETAKRQLATLVYYPEHKLPPRLEDPAERREWYRATLQRLVALCHLVAAKYTRSKVRKALPADFAYVIEELLHERDVGGDKQEYVRGIVETIIDLGRADAFSTALARVIQRLAVDRLHILGDVYDRGPGAHLILDRLMDHHAVDFTWGNHDMLWMGAAAGSAACIANAVRVSLRYGNMEILEDGYGINLLPLASFALDTYGDDPAVPFAARIRPDGPQGDRDRRLVTLMHKAITIIQFKLEAEIIRRRPHYEMEDRLLLHRIDHSRGTVEVEGETYPLADVRFPTIDPADPYTLTRREREVFDRLAASFRNSEKLRTHVRFLFAKGGLYLAHNGNLLYHGCIPLTPAGDFQRLTVGRETFWGRSLLDRLERLAREGFFLKDDPDRRRYGQDAMWYLWCGRHSPLFGKSRMATFERYFVDHPTAQAERTNPYYAHRKDPDVCRMILREFGLEPEGGHIVNGHVPVRANRGESPVMAGGLLFDIDGGFSRDYHAMTGTAGYTLIHNSWGLILVRHEPFGSIRETIESDVDILSARNLVERLETRRRVADTDVGRELRAQVEDLRQLLAAYRRGYIKEQG